MQRFALAAAVIALMACSACSDDESENTGNPPAPPPTPGGLTVTATGLTSLTLSWNAADEATSYVLDRSDAGADDFAQVYAGELTTHVDVDLVYVTTYDYRVSAVNAGGESDPSPTISGLTDTPTGFTVTGSPGGHVDATFSYLDEFGGKPRYQSDPIGLWILSPTVGDRAGEWCFVDQIEGVDIFHHTGSADYPPPTGWLTVVGDTETSIRLNPFVD